MKKRKNTAAKVMAFFALFAIVVGILGTAVIFIVSSFSARQQSTLSQEDLEKLIESFSGSITELSSTGATE